MTSFTNRNFSSNVSECDRLVESVGTAGEIHLLRSLFSLVDFSAPAEDKYQQQVSFIPGPNKYKAWLLVSYILFCSFISVLNPAYQRSFRAIQFFVLITKCRSSACRLRLASICRGHRSDLAVVPAPHRPLSRGAFPLLSGGHQEGRSCFSGHRSTQVYRRDPQQQG